MQKHEKAFRREGRFARYDKEKESPSFSSTLLEKIYRSIDDDGQKTVMANKQSKGKGDEELGLDEEAVFFRRACLIEKWMDRKTDENAEANQRRRQFRHSSSESEKKYNDANYESLFFSSTSSSSDSSSGGFSSSDTESMFGVPRPRPVRTRNADFDEESLIKSKSRALKIYDNLKKVKQPISPGGKLSSFLNSLFAGGAKKKPAAPSFREASSASSFSRSCLSKSSPATRERLRSSGGGLTQRSVRFYPVSVIVGEDSRPCGQKSLREDRRSAPIAKNTGRSPAKTVESEVRVRSEAAREFLRDFRQNQLKNERMILRDENIVKSNKKLIGKKEKEEFDEDDDDDSASCSSSDLFELDHLRYQQELPVYETTRFDRNRAIF